MANGLKSVAIISVVPTELIRFDVLFAIAIG
jgi:hypothetical protein